MNQFCSLLRNVCKHVVDALSGLAGRLVYPGDQVVALLAEGVHVGVAHARTKVGLVAASCIKT